MNINTLIKAPEYDFLRSNPHLGRNIIFLTFGGSWAYGTNIETSDIDVRGCALNAKSDLIGMSNFEQVLDEATDTTIYAFNKLINLILNCNPNIIEMLGCKPEHYCLMSDIGRELINNRKMFLSKKAVASFGGYATSQLRRLQNNLTRYTLTEEEKQKHIVGSCKSAMYSFNEQFASFPEGAIKLYVDKSECEDIKTDIFLDVSLHKYPLKDYNGIWNVLVSIAKDYNTLNGRNKKKDDIHLNKHAMHLVRLYLMCFDILERGEIITYREADHDLLMNIRNGGFQKKNGAIDDSFFDLINQYEKRLEYDTKNTGLPNNPDYKQAEEFVMSVNERVIRYDY